MATNSINVPGLVSMIVFYLLILVIGILAAWFKTRKRTLKKDASAASTVAMVADRDIGLFVGIFTMTATWVGGGYINGTAEQVFTKGILWAQAPLGFAISLIIGAFFFAGPMRGQNYLTMLDPFQNKYGDRIGGLLYLPALCGELFWSAAILNALGSSVSVILHLNFQTSVIASACVAVAYTFFGGLYSVAYTDVVQLICIFVGLIPCIPYSIQNEQVNMTLATDYSHKYLIANETLVVAADYWGTIPNSKLATYIDDYLLLIFGGIPWQVYFQRVLSSKTVGKAQLLSVFAGIFSIVFAVIAGAIGFIARFADWETAGYPEAYIHPQTVLPALIQYLTTPVVSFLGLGAISAAVMSSSDSSMLSASSMFAYNIYKMIFRQKASETEVVWVLRISIVVCGAVACAIGIYAESVYDLFYLCGDLVYVLLFPQLFLVIYVSWVNSYGVLSGFLTGFVLRMLLGEPSTFHIPAILNFSKYIPQKSIVMLINLFVTLLVSLTSHILFVKTKKISLKYDFLNAFKEGSEKVQWQHFWTDNKSRRSKVRDQNDQTNQVTYF